MTLGPSGFPSGPLVEGSTAAAVGTNGSMCSAFDTASETGTTMSRFFFARLNCCLAGHDFSIRQAGGRMFLECTACGYRTEGIALTARGEKHSTPGRSRFVPLGSVRVSAQTQREVTS